MSERERERVGQTARKTEITSVHNGEIGQRRKVNVACARARTHTHTHTT